jgi:hypothetical protein
MSPTYNAWQNMIARCYNPNHPWFQDYGARGITVCERWHKFENFLADMGERPKSLTLERKRNSEGYSPDNCIWATAQEQARNRRNTRYLTIGEVTKPLWQWAEEYGISISTIHVRLTAGWSDERAITTPVRKGKYHAF